MAHGPVEKPLSLQYALIASSKRLGIPTNESGVCFGLAALSVLVYFDDDQKFRDHFHQCLKFLMSTPVSSPDTITVPVQRVMGLSDRVGGLDSIGDDAPAICSLSSAPLPIASSVGVVGEENKVELNVKDFLILLNVLHLPSLFSWKPASLVVPGDEQSSGLMVLPDVIRHVTKNHPVCARLRLDCVSSLLASAVSAPSLSTPAAFLNIRTIEQIYTQSDLQKYFEFIAGVSGTNRCGIILSSMQHAVSVTFRSDYRYRGKPIFFYCDANSKRLKSCDNLAQLAAWVFQGLLAGGDYLAVRSDVICTPSLPNPLSELASHSDWLTFCQDIDKNTALFQGRYFWDSISTAAVNGYDVQFQTPGRLPIQKLKWFHVQLALKHGHPTTAMAILSHLMANALNNNVVLLKEVFSAYIDRSRTFFGFLSGHGQVGRDAATRILEKELFPMYDRNIFGADSSISALVASYQRQIKALKTFAISLIPASSGTRSGSLRTVLTDFADHIDGLARKDIDAIQKLPMLSTVFYSAESDELGVSPVFAAPTREV